jgi:hypothetical protein
MKHKLSVTIVVIIAASFLYLMASIVPPYDLTISNMLETKRRIMRYAHIHNELPEKINSLPKIEGHVNSVLDGWGRPIIYSHDEKNGNVTLISLGENGDPDCKSNKSCIVRHFKTNTEEGEWVDELIDWNKR